MKISFIAWTRFDHRSQLLSKNLGATMHFIFKSKRSNLFLLPWRYFTQSLQMWRTLVGERPDIVFVQNPPIFCVLIAFFYAKLYQARYVVDSHTAAFLSPKWRGTLGLHRILSHQALLTIVHNESQEEIVKKWGCRYYVLDDPLKGYPQGKPFPLTAKFNIIVISTFSEDEPLDVIFEAANLLPDVTFYITGDYKRVRSILSTRIPPNCKLTGFLPYEEYVGLLKGADVIMDLTTRDHTLLCGAFEAVSLGKPLITSDWKILRDHFPSGVVYVPNTAEGIFQGVRRVQEDLLIYQRDISELREHLVREWDRKFVELNRLLTSA